MEYQLILISTDYTINCSKYFGIIDLEMKLFLCGGKRETERETLAYFKILSQNLYGEAEEYHQKPHLR
jgi:hypothetical protein